MVRRTRALVITGIALLLAAVLCGAGIVLAQRLPGIAGCDEGPPYVSGVQDDVDKITGMVPGLAGEPGASAGATGAPAGVAGTHYRWREARPRTCPDIGPMDYYYEGFATLTPERAAAMRARYTWTEAGAPDVPDELDQYAPPQAAWQRAADLDAGNSTTIWLDRTSDTVYFSYLRG